MTDISIARVVRLLIFATTLSVLAGCGPTDDPPSPEPGESSSSSPAPSATDELDLGAIHDTYDVGGHELFLDCEGTGSPTVVMVHGIIWDGGDLASGGSPEWDWTRDHLGETRTCAYDRRNVGESERVPGMSSAADAIKDLHGLLRAAGEEPPYVLAGYSFGGLLTLLYAGTYPDEVDGIALVDATLPLEWDLDPPEMRAKIREELNANAERIDFYGAGAMTASVVDDLPKVPITYLRAVRQKDPPEWEKGAYEAALREFMRDLPDGRLVKYDTTHDMVFTIPGDVADQISRVLVRTST